MNTVIRSHKLLAAGAVALAAGSAGAVLAAQAPAQPARAALTPRLRRVRLSRPRRIIKRRTHHHVHRTSSHGYSIPASIVMCESGGNYRAVNPSSGAGGAYQILPSTWAAYGGTGLPQNAPPAEQDAIAAKIYATAGPSQWSCG
jgi:Transglycosylase-like domain